MEVFIVFSDREGSVEQVEMWRQIQEGGAEATAKQVPTILLFVSTSFTTSRSTHLHLPLSPPPRTPSDTELIVERSHSNLLFLT